MTGNVARACCSEIYELPFIQSILGQSFHPGGPKLTRQLASTALVGPGAEVIDIACGIGSSASTLVPDFGASVTGCDLSAINLKRARNASINSGQANRARYVRGSAERLPFGDAAFEVALCECSLCLFDNFEAALAQMYRVLKPGGRIGVSEFYLNGTLPAILDGPLGLALCVAGALTKTAIDDAFKRAGFQHVRIRPANWALTELITRIRRGLAVLNASEANSDAAIPASWGDPAPVLAAFEQFVGDGQAGYLIVSANKPSGRRTT